MNNVMIVKTEQKLFDKIVWNSTRQSVVFFPDRVSKLTAPFTKCTVLHSEKITENKADSSACGLSTVR